MGKVLTVILLLYAFACLTFFRRHLIARFGALISYSAKPDELANDDGFIINCKLVGSMAAIFATGMLVTVLYNNFW